VELDVALDADVLDSILNYVNPCWKAREVEIKLIARLRKHAGNPKFTELGERLEKVRKSPRPRWKRRIGWTPRRSWTGPWRR
jgi:hypothetical protein